ncbi:uncharacterized protein LOC110435983 [Sorghum bicolor]|uniref:uncharacterized protein LOC110435983 n=1 Tax=Sorghum bicolor TaxID=4558 RepID=UPI000B42506A|nr:uncharacterized protein LOC110435983 [Sorghum bicolor]|eukprot:XP_021317789.1 uncharacterized protein LOC110435983 [Sorghum bicolor]
MDPAVKSAFEELIRRFDSFDAKWEARFADAESARRDHDDETERRLAAVEAFTSSVPGPAARHSALEDYCSANSEAAVAAEEWNRGFSNRVGELEEKMDDLELIRFSEMRDERDDRVAALEDAAVVFDEWRPWVEASVHDICLEIKRLKGVERSPATRTSSGRLGVAPFTESASARPPAGEKADWPNGHREQGYGSVTTLAHPAVHDTLAYTTRFIDGLREDIRAVILVARPASLDAAYTLASLQEEAGGPVRTRDRRTDFSKFSAGRGGLGSPMPQGRMADDKPSGSKFSSPEDKLSSLKNFHRARGLCIRCGEKWAPGHKCSSQPQLHALQEVWELFQDSFQDEEEDPHSDDQEPAVDAPSHLFFTCSAAAVQGQSSLHTMQFSGKLLGHQVSILVDSGSSHSFISTATASLLSGHQPLPHPVSVKVANGDTILCETVIPDVEWSVQSYTFHSTFRVLPLGSYDIILGMDWLEAFSPMKVNWRNKWMSISYGSGSVLLHGLGDVSENCSSVMVFSISSDAVDQPTHTVHPQVQSILDEFSQLFAEPSTLPPRRDCDHSIPLVPGAQPVCIRQYRYSPKLKSEIESQVSELLRTGMIRPSRSPFSSPVLLVKKKDQSWRMCVDYRMLNALTVKSKFPIPVIDELLDELAQARWFSCLDLRAGFNQIRMAPGEEYKTAFQTHRGHFEYNVMSFGLTGAPNTFQGAMNVTLKPLLRVCVIVFFDDILVYSPSWEQHLVHLRQVFELLQQDQWLVKLSKCRFAQESIAYLGHVISADGVSTDPSKLESIRSWPVPKDVKDLRSFLGLAGYYRKFVQHFAVIARPLYDLLKKGVVFCWTSTHSTAFSALQSALMSAPVLALPDFNKPFQIQTDASDTGVGAVLMQDGHPLAFVSKSLGPRTRGLSTYDKEYLAILVAVDQWRSYLQHNEFTIFTDQRSLIHVSDQRLHTPWQLKMYTRLAGLQYRVIYKPGTTNKAADALSRHPEAPSQLQAISSVTPTWLADVVTGYSSDPYASKLLQQLSVNPDSSPPYSLTGGIIRYKGRIWLGSNVPLHHRVMSALHNSALGGHSGFPVTYARIKQHFAWRGMKADIRNFVTTCSVISMDFIDGLPTSGTANCILVIVDKFSKYAHFVPLHHPYTAGKVAQAFLDSVFKLHGLPTHIISDRDPVFTSAFWNELFRLAKTWKTLCKSLRRSCSVVFTLAATVLCNRCSSNGQVSMSPWLPGKTRKRSSNASHARRLGDKPVPR